eukprot:SAG31_NODE_689_length_12806_cov_5.358857_20_plen_204_part_00
MKARKDVESRMERFKVCEKETKTKAFSKEGLAAAEKSDPAEVARQEARDWVNSTLAELQVLVDTCEAEIESLDTGKKKQKKAAADKMAEISEKMEQHNFHIGKLEGVLRGIDNHNITVDDVEAIKEDVQYYLDSHDDPDFYMDDAIYDELNFDAEGIDLDLGISKEEEEPEPPPAPAPAPKAAVKDVQQAKVSCLWSHQDQPH